MTERITSDDLSVYLPDQPWEKKEESTGTVIKQEGWIKDDLHVSPAERLKRKKKQGVVYELLSKDEKAKLLIEKTQSKKFELEFDDEIFKHHYDNYLQAHAARTVWQSPYQDEQYILELSQLSHPRGVRLDTEIFDRQIKMPDNRNIWHVYMIGGNLPFDFGLPDITEKWVPVTDWVNNSTFTARFYNDKGIQIPLYAIYYGKEYDDNLIIAVREVEGVDFNWGKEPLYVHFRNQYYWHSHLNESKSERTFLLSEMLRKNGDINPHLVNLNKPGKFPDIQINGQMRNVPITPESETSYQTMVDPSVIDIQYHRVGDLQTYQSTLDKKNKYLLYLYDREGMERDVVYRDDVEIFLLKFDESMYEGREKAVADFINTMSLYVREYREGNYDWFRDLVDGKFNPAIGVYYHRNQEDSLRMVTHRSYGIPVDNLHRLISLHDNRLELDRWWIKVVVRKSGLGTKLISERNRVGYLNRLPYKDRIDAMVNTESTLVFWKARELERSDYNYIMRCFFHELTSDRILSAYGYQQAAYALANPSVSITREDKVENNYFLLPVGIADAATVFEYNDEGRMIGWYHHRGSYRYGPVNEETTYIEAFSGYGSDWIGGIDNPDEIKIEPLVNKRLYRCNVATNGEMITPWQDITKDVFPESREFDSFEVQRQVGDVDYLLSDNRWLCRTMQFNIASIKRAGYVKFTLAGRATKEGQVEPLRVPYDKIDIWVNGYALIEGIDFYVKFPEVVICKGDLFEGYDVKDEEATISVTVRAMGFVDQNMKRSDIVERGFKINNKLSVDNEYMLHQYSHRRIVEGGKVANPIVYQFDEYGEAEGVFDIPEDPKRPRMMPYSIDNFAIALRGFGGHLNVYNSREDDLVREREIIKYYTHNMGNQKEKKKVDKTVNHIEYPLYSPFLSAIIEKILVDQDQYLKFDYNNKTKLNRFVSQFKYLLESDPAHLNTHGEHVKIFPRAIPYTKPTTVHYSILAMLEKIVETYLNGLVDLNHWFKVVKTREKKQTKSSTGAKA